MHWTRDCASVSIEHHWPAPVMRSVRRRCEMSSPGENAVVNRENRDLRPQFSNTAAAYRRRRVQLWFIEVPLMLLFWYLLLFVPGERLLALLTFLALFITLLLGEFTLPKLICPMCELAADGEIIRFCSECGSDKLQTKG